MPETIYKLQPNRTMHLRGFDSFGAAAAMHHATANSFAVSGVFRDAADFAVLILYDADNFYEHPRLKYLPDFDFEGLTLQFDVQYEGLRPLDSPRYATIDWPYLDVIREDHTTGRVRLSEHATLVSGTPEKASAVFTIVDDGLKEYDRLTLWFQNFAFDYVVPKVECAYAFAGAGAGTVHRITIGTTDYVYTETLSDTTTSIVIALAALVNASPELQATIDPPWQLNLRAKIDNEAEIEVSSSASLLTHTLYGIGPHAVAANLAWQINSVDWTGLAIALPIEATVSGAALTVRCAKPGVDGNAISMYSVAKNPRLRTEALRQFSGGSSDGIWRVSLDFTALGIGSVRQMWFTYAPPLAEAAVLPATEWQATYTNWNLSGDLAKRQLLVAGLDSVRVEENSSWCKYTRKWRQVEGFYSGAFAMRTKRCGAQVEVSYSCNSTHNLYLGTTLFHDRGRVRASLDEDEATTHNLAVSAEAPIYTRRKLRSGVAAGRHRVVLTLENHAIFDFDFLEAAVATDVPDPLPVRTHVSPALDYSTDHTYKLPPQRIHWIFDQLGFAGPMNEYVGVFWWNQRQRVGAMVPSATVTLSGSFAEGDQIILWIGGSPIGKTVFANETNEILAQHFASFINTTLVGVYAEVDEATLRITNRSPTPAYSFTLTKELELGGSSTGVVSLDGSLTGGTPGKWEIDLSQSPPLNRAARDWHADFFGEAAARARDVVVACSMELVHPPSGFAARYPDGQEVITDVGFASLSSTHCAFNSNMRNYQQEVYLQLADLQAEAGLVPYLQFGEFLWWFFTNETAENPDGGMGFYDEETAALAAATLGRPLHVFRKPTDLPTVNDGADASFLRDRLRDHIAALRVHVSAAHSNARFELLYPYDVNHPTPAGVHNLGGALNYFVNLPTEFLMKPGSGLDSFKMEALDFGAWSRSLDLSRLAIEFPIGLGWPKDSLRYLVPVFRGGSAWQKEYLDAKGMGIPVIHFWAFDHFNLYNLDCREPEKFATLSGGR
ncbi:hypothetical protein [Bryobacter aggregatus]|uniref:non-contractile tail sheath protein n=1 Tax=Bryobacter aggregatus TaxID=360054 RepID=UPI0004E1B321|nr:hypothetical protein [Bryobacter aggregatus]